MKELLELLSYGLYSRKKEVDVEKPAAHTEKRQESQSSEGRSEKPLEPTDSEQKDDFDSATHELHDMVRHWLSLKQDCGDLLAQLGFLHDTYNMVRDKRGSDWLLDPTSDAGESFEVLKSQCDICVRWTQVYYDRIQTRIGLVSYTPASSTVLLRLTPEPSFSISPINARLRILLESQNRPNEILLR
jgi:hypothetical protein